MTISFTPTAVSPASETLTVYFCGTGSNEHDAEPSAKFFNGELISTLAAHTQGMSHVDKLLVNGPASGNIDTDSLYVPAHAHARVLGKALGAGIEENAWHALHVAAGTMHPDCPAFRKRVEPGIATGPAGASGPHGAVAPGWTSWALQSIQHAAQGLGRWFMPAGPLPVVENVKPQPSGLGGLASLARYRQINVVGWSRGAATAHMFTNLLAEHRTLSSIPVKLIAIDPVPGPGNFDKRITTLQGNVKDYRVIYARDERTLAFEPTYADRVCPEETARTVMVMPGRHATLVGNAGDYGTGVSKQALQAVGQKVRMQVAAWLREWGTDIAEVVPGRATYVPLFDAKRMAVLDARIDQSKAQIEALRGTGYFTSAATSSERWMARGEGEWETLSSVFSSDVIQTGLRRSALSADIAARPVPQAEIDKVSSGPASSWGAAFLRAARQWLVGQPDVLIKQTSTLFLARAA